MWSPAGGHKGRPYKGLSPPSAFRRRRCPHRPALHRVGAPSILPLFISAFLSCLRRPRFLAEESGGKDGSGRGILISPAPTPHPLKRPIRGAAAPLLDVPPRKGGYASPSGAAGALQRKPPPSESRQQDGSGETPRRGNRNSPFLVVSRGMGVGKGENRNSPFPTGSFAPFWPLRKGPAGGMTRKQVSKRVPMEGAPARHKAGRCRQKVNCLREAKEAAPTVERTAHKTQPVSGPYLRRNTWTRKEARTRRPSRAASRSAPSLGVFQ